MRNHIAAYVIFAEMVQAWVLPPSSISECALQFSHLPTHAPASTLRMGLIDSVSDFLNDRTGDFVKLDTGDDAFGPGPLIILYGIPDGVLDDEIQDMLADGSPIAYKKGCTLARIGLDDEILNQSFENALDIIAGEPGELGGIKTSVSPSQEKIPVLLFSGFRNDEMMNVYNIIGPEIYHETGGASTPACAKAVPNALEKPLRQVIEEISGDHTDAMGAR